MNPRWASARLTASAVGPFDLKPLGFPATAYGSVNGASCSLTAIVIVLEDPKRPLELVPRLPLVHVGGQRRDIRPLAIRALDEQRARGVEIAELVHGGRDPVLTADGVRGSGHGNLLAGIRDALRHPGREVVAAVVGGVEAVGRE